MELERLNAIEYEKQVALKEKLAAEEKERNMTPLEKK